jgi:hypothetical protein
VLGTFSGLENVVRLARAPLGERQWIRRKCYVQINPAGPSPFSHTVSAPTFLSFFLFFPSLLLHFHLPLHLQPPTFLISSYGTVSPLRRTRNQPPICPSAHSSCTETRVPAPRVTQGFLQRFLSSPSLHEQASVGTAFNSGNPSSKRVIDLRHDM